MKNSLVKNTHYQKWLKELKEKFRESQLKAALSVNTTLLNFYWNLGADIVEKQKQTVWGSGFLKQLSQDLMADFPEIKGFSQRNLKFIRQWYLFYTQLDGKTKQPVSGIGKQPVSQLELTPNQVLTKIPWGHNIVIVQKCDCVEKALFYVNKTLENNWSRSVLTHQIESNLFSRQNINASNFEITLPSPQSDLAKETLKDPYNFDFLTLSENFTEKELEHGLLEHLTQFLIELGSGFAYMGKQVPLQVGEREFYLDLLFYHTRLHCHIVIELKVIEFEPEHVGKLNFYIKAIDEQMRSKDDNPTIGILLCKKKDKLIAEYALSDINKPMGITEYQLTQSLPDQFKSSLPSIQEIEDELTGGLDNNKALSEKVSSKKKSGDIKNSH